MAKPVDSENLEHYLTEYADQRGLSRAAARRAAIRALMQQETERLAREEEESHLPVFVAELAFPA